MVFNEVTSVPEEALPVEEFRAHLRLGTGFGQETLQDEVLAAFLRAAIAAIEGQTGKSLIVREYDMIVSAWVNPQAQPLPVAPVTTLGELVLIDRDGIETPVDGAEYALKLDMSRPVLRPAGARLPLIPLIGSARLRFKAGLATEWGELPADLGQAVLLLAAYYYEQRAESGAGGGWMPYGVTSLLRRYRNVRLSARSVQ